MRRLTALLLAAVLLIPVTIPVSAAGDSLSAQSVIYDSAFRSQMNTQFSLLPFGSVNFLAWDAMDQLVSTIGIGAFSSLASLERAAASLRSVETRFELGSPVVTLVEILSLRDPLADWVVIPHAEYGYVIGSSKTGLVLCNSAGAFPYYKPATESDSQGGGKWIGSKSCDINGKVVVLTADVLGNLCLTLNQAGETCSLTKWGDKYLVIAKDQYFYYCNPDGIPYVFRVDQNYAVDSPNNYYTNNEGDNVYNGGDTVNNNLIDNSSSTIWFPDGTFQYIDQLIYDESTKTYYVDAHEEYNTTNNTYVSNSYQYQYHIEYTSITYIGSTAEYDEEYHLYYELPDGRSSADLTAEDLEVLNVSMDVIPYVRSADDTSIRALYHFDGDTLDSSYWSYTGNLEWVKGASITYMEANAFNGALYLDENEHEFVVHIPGNLLSSDFTIQFRYYQSETKAPKSDSTVYIGDQLRFIFTGSEFIGSSGSLVSASIGSWQDICMMRRSGILYYFVNGVCYGSVADSTVYSDEIKFTFGSDQQTYKYFDELRILNKAAYDPSGYTPSSVPFDTNLALVLPDTVTPVADEYWKFNADGNLFIDYNWDGDYIRPSLFNGGGWQYVSNRYVVPELLSGSVRLTSKAASIPSGVLNGDPVDSFGVHFNLGGWTGSGGYFYSSSLLSSDLYESGTYTFSIMLADGTVCSVTAKLSSINSATGVFSYLPNGAAVRIAKSMYGDADSYSYYASIYPPPGGSIDIVYVELVEGNSANTGHEFVSAVAAIDREDIDMATLAVRTDLEITGHQIGGVRPSLPTKGLVWALVEAGRMTSLQIYNGQAWEEVDGRIWTGSRWIPYYAFDVLLLKDMYDVVESDPTMNPIYTEAGFWKWLQDAWAVMLDKLEQIIEALSGGRGPFDDCEHQYSSRVDREPGCAEPGLMIFTCDKCGHAYTEIIDATGHDWVLSESNSVISSGTVITLNDSAERPLRGLTLYGKTTQVTTTGKNLLKNTAINSSVSGVTFVPNADGSITVNGTNSASVGAICRVGSFLFEGGVSYYLSGGVSGSLSVDVRDDNGVIINGFTNYGGDVLVKFNADTQAQVYVRVAPATAVNNTTVYPMIRLASVSDATYEPYTGGIPAPNPGYSQSLISVGDRGIITVKVGASETDGSSQILTVSTPNGLSGIPVTTGGNYTDENGQQWICDEVDFESGEYVQRIECVTLDELSIVHKSSAAGGGYGHYIVYTGGSSFYDKLGNACPLLCSKFGTRPDGGQSWGVLNTVFLNRDNNGFYFVMDAPDVETAKAALVGTKIIYAISEEKRIALSAEELDQYAALHTVSPSTTIYNDSGAGMAVSYMPESKPYDVLVCSKCGAKAKDHGNGIDETDLFEALGDFVAEGITWFFDLLTDLVDSLSGIVDTFRNYTERVGALTGTYPAFFAAFMALVPEDLRLLLWFAFVGFVGLVVWRKVTR